LNLKDRLQAIKLQISEACLQAGRNPQEVELLAVSKGHPASTLRHMHELGMQRFGENYVPDMEAKALALKELAISWVYIGHLQSNKIQRIVQVASEIQTVSSFKHANFIARYAQELNKTPFPIYIAINADNEPQKSGVPMSAAAGLVSKIENELPQLKIKGIMAIPSSAYSDKEDRAPPAVYKELRELANQIGEHKLSLGMSGDLKLSIAAGSTCVRIGTALFGERKAP